MARDKTDMASAVGLLSNNGDRKQATHVSIKSNNVYVIAEVSETQEGIRKKENSERKAMK